LYANKEVTPMDAPTKKSPTILDLASGMVAEELAVLRRYLDQASENQPDTTGSEPATSKKRPSASAPKKKLRHSMA